MNTTVQKYAPALLSFVVLVVGGLQAAVAAGPLTWVVLVQLAILTATTASTYLAPLAGERWRGAIKTGLEILGVVLVLVLPYVALGRITPAEVLLVIVAIIKAAAAQLGVIIRTDDTAARHLADTRPLVGGDLVVNTTATGGESVRDVAEQVRLDLEQERHLGVPSSRSAE